MDDTMTQAVEAAERFDWKRWFAWYPVKTEGGANIWFKMVWRKRLLTRYLFISRYMYSTTEELAGRYR